VFWKNACDEALDGGESFTTASDTATAFSFQGINQPLGKEEGGSPERNEWSYAAKEKQC